MGKIGKQTTAPGFQCIHRERKQIEDKKHHYLSQSWFVEELKQRLDQYNSRLRDKHWEQDYKLKWNRKKEKYVHVKMSNEEWMYEHINNWGKEPEVYDKYHEPLVIHEWNFESRVIFEKLIRERGKLLVYEVYLERKEKMDMLLEDDRKNNRTKTVRFQDSIE